jgi:hypothetical protein
MSFTLIKTQLKQDLIGKDAYRGITLSYAWLANQFGHIGLGFIPAVIGIHIFEYFNADTVFYSLPAIIVWGFWLRFELKNFDISVLTKEKTKNKEQYQQSYYYKIRFHFFYDLIVDLSFFAFGALLAYLVFYPAICVIIILFLSLFILLYASSYWYLAKIYVQKALYPFQYRFSQWNHAISTDNNTKIYKFMEADNACTHVLVFGNDDNEKIHVSIGMATELSFQLVKCRYFTAMKLFEAFHRNEAEDSKEEVISNAWNWHQSSVIVIDDINPSHADIKNIIEPEEFLRIMKCQYWESNKNLLRQKKVIWMLGKDDDENVEKTKWTNMLLDIGVYKDDIVCVNLDDNKKEEIPQDKI